MRGKKLLLDDAFAEFRRLGAAPLGERIVGAVINTLDVGGEDAAFEVTRAYAPAERMR
jgi:hypothetical protein